VPQAIEFLEEAVADAEAAAIWYAERSPKAALAFTREIESAIAEILRLPDAWPPFLHGTRRFLLKRFPCSVVYRATPDRILIIAVAHGYRRPGFWRKRLA